MTEIHNISNRHTCLTGRQVWLFFLVILAVLITPLFSYASSNISYPAQGETVGENPVFIGQATPLAAVEIWDITSIPIQVIITTADANGAWQVKISNNLPVGNRIFKTVVGGIDGPSSAITISTIAPSTVPIINYPAENQLLVRATNLSVIGMTDPVDAGKVITATANINTGPALLYDMNMGTAIVQPDGSFEISLNKPLPRGTRQIALICDGVVSDLRTVILVDPVGTLFDSVTNQPINGMTVTLYRRIPQTDPWEVCPVDISGATPGAIGGPIPPQVPSNVKNPQVSGWTGRAGEYQFLLNQPAVGQPYEYKLIVTNSSDYTFPTALPAYQVVTSTIVGSAGTAQTPSFINIFPNDPVTRTLYVDNN